MTTAEHPDLDTLLHATDGESEALRAVGAHLETCGDCRDRVARLRGIFATAADELIDLRPDCPTPDELGRLGPGAETSDAHVRECPICQKELEVLRSFDRDDDVGVDLSGLPLHRPEFLDRGAPAAVYQSLVQSREMPLDDGSELTATIGEVRIDLRCEEARLTVTVRGNVTEKLILVLSDDDLEKRVPVTAGETHLNVGSWRRVRLEVE